MTRPDPTEENARQVFDALVAFGAPIVAHGIRPTDFAVSGNIQQIGLPPRRTDILTSIRGVSFDEVWASRTHVRLGGVSVFVIGRAAIADQSGTAATDFGIDVATDASGRFYLLARTDGTYPVQTSAGGTDVVVVACDANGQPTLTRQLGASGTETALALVATPAGATYVVGTTYGTFPMLTYGGGTTASSRPSTLPSSSRASAPSLRPGTTPPSTSPTTREAAWWSRTARAARSTGRPPSVPTISSCAPSRPEGRRSPVPRRRGGRASPTGPIGQIDDPGLVSPSPWA